MIYKSYEAACKPAIEVARDLAGETGQKLYVDSLKIILGAYKSIFEKAQKDGRNKRITIGATEKLFTTEKLNYKTLIDIHLVYQAKTNQFITYFVK